MSNLTSANQARRDQVFELYAHLVRPIASGLKATLPANIDRADLTQSGNVALLDIAAHLEGYARTRIRGAMLDSIKGRGQIHDKYVGQLDGFSVTEFPEFSQPPKPSIEEQIDGKRRGQRVAAAIAVLPAQERRVIKEKLSGATILDIAKREKVSTRTVKRRNSDAITHLRAAMAA
jgi:RNA polymerase sigma factor (sigma-70 family)